MGSSHIVKPIERRPRCRWGHRRELGAFRDSDVTTAYEETALQLFLRSLACAAVPILRVVNPPGGEVRNIHPLSRLPARLAKSAPLVNRWGDETVRGLASPKFSLPAKAGTSHPELVNWDWVNNVLWSAR
jgi:hypothetical protein